MDKNQIKHSLQNRKFKSGTYSMGIIAIAIAIVIVINLIVSSLPASIMKLDVSFNNMYSITDTTKEFLKNLSEDVKIYVMAVTGEENKDVMEMLGRYQAMSSHIKVETVDPVLHPNFASQYTQESVKSGDYLVVSDKRSSIINSSEIYETTFDNYTYQNNITGFDAEGQLTAAIHYVTTDNLPIVYALEGHNEIEIPQSLKALIGKNSMELSTLNLSTSEKVPEDASCVLINAPESDILKEEAQKLIDYLEAGGTAFIATGDNASKLTNLNTVLEYYGVTVEPGLTIDSNSGSYWNRYPYYLAPEKKSHSITSDLISAKANLFIPYAEAIFNTEDARSSITITPLLVTSDKSFLRTMENSQSDSISMMDGDIEGPITVGAAISESHGDVETKIVLYSTAFMADESANSNTNGNNFKLFTNSLSWLCEMESSVAIDAKSLTYTQLQTTAAAINTWTIVWVIFIPGLTLLIGLFVCIYRRRK